MNGSSENTEFRPTLDVTLDVFIIGALAVYVTNVYAGAFVALLMMLLIGPLIPLEIQQVNYAAYLFIAFIALSIIMNLLVASYWCLSGIMMRDKRRMVLLAVIWIIWDVILYPANFLQASDVIGSVALAGMVIWRRKTIFVS